MYTITVWKFDTEQGRWIQVERSVADGLGDRLDQVNRIEDQYRGSPDRHQLMVESAGGTILQMDYV